jgi:predicted glycosyltransferase
MTATGSKAADVRRRRFAMFTHDAYGLGHVRRSTRILRALAEREPRSALLLITGSPATHLLRELPPNADTLKLPTIVTSGVDGTRPPTLDIGVAELASLRGELTRRALELFAPDVLLVDNFPLGTRLELLPALRDLRQTSTRAVLGLRDVVDPPEKVRRDWHRDGLLDIIARYYERVLIYGVPEVLDAVEAYGLPEDVAARVAYCGYVTETKPSSRTPEQVRRELSLGERFLLATVGGGGDGRPVLEAFLGAIERMCEWPAVIVTGEFMSAEDRQAVVRAAAGRRGLLVESHVGDLPAIMAAAELVVAMGGYNTSAEILATRTRAVLVPRVWRSGEHASRGRTGVDAEQLVRVEGLARLGLVDMVDPRELSAETLHSAIGRALRRPRSPAGPALRLDGAACVADHLLQIAENKKGAAA